MKTIKVNTSRDIPKNFTGIVYLFNKDKQWVKDGRLHRLDGPAIELINGSKIWYIEGKRHRVDGPAYEDVRNNKGWWIEDRWYTAFELKYFVDTSIYLGKEKGKHDIEWLKFLHENEIKEFPIIPGMECNKDFKRLFDQIFGAPIT
jgi:hypothetical protein